MRILQDWQENSVVLEEKLRLKPREKMNQKRGNREELKKKKKKKKKKERDLALANSNQRFHLSLKKNRQLPMLRSAKTWPKGQQFNMEGESYPYLIDWALTKFSEPPLTRHRSDDQRIKGCWKLPQHKRVFPGLCKRYKPRMKGSSESSDINRFWTNQVNVVGNQSIKQLTDQS